MSQCQKKKKIQTHPEENDNTCVTWHNTEYGIFTFPESVAQYVSTKDFRSVYKSSTLLNR